MAEPFAIKVEGDTSDVADYIYDTHHCVASLFFSSTSDNNPIFRRDWLDEGAIKYNILVNYEALKAIAPDFVARLIDNGICIFEHFDGPEGGITR